MTGVMETDIIFIPEQKTADPARSAAFSVYMSVKNTLLSEFFSEALVILVKNSLTFSMIFFIIVTLNLSKTNELLTLLLRLRGQA